MSLTSLLQVGQIMVMTQSPRIFDQELILHAMIEMILDIDKKSLLIKEL